MMDKNIELLGLNILIKDAENRSLIGLKGKIVDETRNMWVIETGKGQKKVIKSQVLAEVDVNGEKREIKGKNVVGRTEERIR